MSTVQIVGIVVAAAVVLLIVIALLVTRRQGEQAEPAAEAVVEAAPEMAPEVVPEDTGSFLDDPVTDTLGGLGKAEREPGPAQPPDDHDILPPEAAPVLAFGAVDDDLAPPPEPATPSGSEAAAGPATGEAQEPADETEITAEIPVVEQVEAQEGAAPRMMPLSAVIVTTSEKLVDVNDPDVRRMLTDLVTFEIDQAAEYGRQGQTVDALLQLTEAEKICNALGLQDTAQGIRRMMDDLKD